MIQPREIESIHKDDHKNKYNMYSRNAHSLIYGVALMMVSFLLVSCEAVGEVFKAGMSFGIFIVVAIVIIVILLMIRTGKNKTS